MKTVIHLTYYKAFTCCTRALNTTSNTIKKLIASPLLLCTEATGRKKRQGKVRDIENSHICTQTADAETF